MDSPAPLDTNPPAQRPDDAGMTRLVDVDVLARSWGLAPSTVRRLVQNENLPHYRFGPRAIRFDPDEVEAWREARKLGDAARYNDAVARLVAAAPQMTRSQADIIASLLTRGGESK